MLEGLFLIIKSPSEPALTFELSVRVVIKIIKIFLTYKIPYKVYNFNVN